jgi:hypothetical protein
MEKFCCCADICSKRMTTYIKSEQKTLLQDIYTKEVLLKPMRIGRCVLCQLLLKGCYCYRLASYLDQWPHLEKWFDQFAILRHVDASAAKETVITEAEEIIEQTIEKVRENIKFITIMDAFNCE